MIMVEVAQEGCGESGGIRGYRGEPTLRAPPCRIFRQHQFGRRVKYRRTFRSP